MAGNLRLDTAVALRGLARSRSAAAELVTAGSVLVDGVVRRKPSLKVTNNTRLELAEATATHYVSRAAGKLVSALDRCSQVQLDGAVCLDAGSSTGGFTQVLLERGAALVHAVDVGTDQLHHSLRDHPAVAVQEQTNIRHLSAGDLTPAPAVVVADLSFISLQVVLPALVTVAVPESQWVLMVKPQFEVGKPRLDGRGVVTDPAAHIDAILGVLQKAWALGLSPTTVCRSAVPGPAGNQEFFVVLRRSHAPGYPQDTAALQAIASSAVTQFSEPDLS